MNSLVFRRYHQKDYGLHPIQVSLVQFLLPVSHFLPSYYFISCFVYLVVCSYIWFVGPPPPLTPAVRPSGLWCHLMPVCQWTLCFSRLPACSDRAVYKAVALMLHIVGCPPWTDIQWPPKVFGHLSYLICIVLFIVTNGSLVIAHTIKNNGSLLASILPWRTFPFH